MFIVIRVQSINDMVIIILNVQCHYKTCKVSEIRYLDCKH
jgi:hypothetical protein